MEQPLALFATAAARSIESRAIALLGNDYLLMQRAGQAAWQCVLQHWPQAQRLVVLCGAGNNGGDGYVLARLAHQAKRQVRVLQFPHALPRTPLAQRAWADYLAAGGYSTASLDELRRADLVIDALFGIGLNRPLDSEDTALIHAINTCNVPVLALDVPSGVDAQNGTVHTLAVKAHCTLQFIVPHCGLYTGAARNHVGQLLLATLDVSAATLSQAPPTAHAWPVSILAHLLPNRHANAHKGQFGHVLCIGGNRGMGGAIMLCAEAALRSGAGRVSVGTRAEYVAPLLARCPEAMVHSIDQAQTLAPLLAQANVIALGPGLGQDGWACRLWSAVLDNENACPLVLDADALNLLARQPRPVPRAILTPHPGEAARLLGVDIAHIQNDRYAAARQLAAKFSAVVLLKGNGTVIAAPEQVSRVINAGNPGMAVAGMGDLLTGIIAALCAQGLNLFDAASSGALLHGLAGDTAAANQGQRGLLPRDLLSYIQTHANP